ncbi:hypothetical protein [Piscinibacter sp.]|uniref:hypothetical protein n=1 Tax=Piscinibacter sp. TaxID=1903157 RepID=UPI002CF1EA2F|nr:hypothetical protein [Albitalea sp.]HUG22778.1 hypothetical protein [Albitalea sp.]
MSRSTLAPLDWRRWRADVVARLDRRWICAASAYAAVLTAVIVVGDNSGHELAAFIFYTLFSFSTVLLTLAVLAVALVAVARGISVWVAYPAAGFAIAAIGTVLGLVIEANCGCPPQPLHVMVVGHLYALSLLCPPAVLYVYASSATHDQKVLRALEAERAAEADRLAQQRLQTELASVDHDLVLRALRLALTVRTRDAAQAEALLEAVTAYLRLAQQRGTSEPGRIAAAWAELRQACSSPAGVPAQQVIA